jgi:hypothetical protein
MWQSLLSNIVKTFRILWAVWPCLMNWAKWTAGLTQHDLFGFKLGWSFAFVLNSEVHLWKLVSLAVLTDNLAPLYTIKLSGGSMHDAQDLLGGSRCHRCLMMQAHRQFLCYAQMLTHSNSLGRLRCLVLLTSEGNRFKLSFLRVFVVLFVLLEWRSVPSRQ